MTLSDKPRILVVDDEPLNVELLQAYLGLDYDVLSAYNGYDALDIISKEMPDLVLLDVMMPDQDGFMVLEKLKSKPEMKNIPVVFITAKNDTNIRKEALDAGAAELIQKPIDVKNILNLFP